MYREAGGEPDNVTSNGFDKKVNSIVSIICITVNLHIVYMLEYIVFVL